MSKSLILKHLVQERLSLAAEEVFALFENAIAEYEEELSRFKDGDQVEPFPSLRIQSVRGDAPYPSSPSPTLNQELFWSTQIKEEPEEHSVSLEEEALMDTVPESSDFFVKHEETHLLQQNQVERIHEETTKALEVHSDNSSSDTDDDDNWAPVLISEPDSENQHLSDDKPKDLHHTDRNSILPRKAKSATKKSGTEHKGDKSGNGQEAKREKHQCKICERTFDMVKGLKIHTMKVHPKDKRETALNGVAAPHTKSVRQNSATVVQKEETHTTKETKEEKHQCAICNKIFDKVRGLMLHVKLHTGEKRYSCSFCGKKFMRKDSRDSHIRTHTGEKPYKCSFCVKSFADYSNLRKHEKSHGESIEVNSVRLPCAHCKKTFLRKDNLLIHMYRMHGDKNILASSFSDFDEASLNEYERSHSGEKTYTCPICKKSFADRASLKKHKTKHAGQAHAEEETFACSYCDQKFTHRSSLQLHQKLHNGEKPFKCLICKKTFDQKSQLQSHKRKHTDERPFC